MPYSINKEPSSPEGLHKTQNVEEDESTSEPTHSSQAEALSFSSHKKTDGATAIILSSTSSLRGLS